MNPNPGSITALANSTGCAFIFIWATKAIGQIPNIPFLWLHSDNRQSRKHWQHHCRISIEPDKAGVGGGTECTCLGLGTVQLHPPLLGPLRSSFQCRHKTASHLRQNPNASTSSCYHQQFETFRKQGDILHFNGLISVSPILVFGWCAGTRPFPLYFPLELKETPQVVSTFAGEEDGNRTTSNDYNFRPCFHGFIV